MVALRRHKGHWPQNQRPPNVVEQGWECWTSEEQVVGKDLEEACHGIGK